MPPRRLFLERFALKSSGSLIYDDLDELEKRFAISEKHRLAAFEKSVLEQQLESLATEELREGGERIRDQQFESFLAAVSETFAANAVDREKSFHEAEANLEAIFRDKEMSREKRFREGEANREEGFRREQELREKRSQWYANIRDLFLQQGRQARDQSCENLKKQLEAQFDILHRFQEDAFAAAENRRDNVVDDMLSARSIPSPGNPRPPRNHQPPQAAISPQSLQDQTSSLPHRSHSRSSEYHNAEMNLLSPASTEFPDAADDSLNRARFMLLENNDPSVAPQRICTHTNSSSDELDSNGGPCPPSVVPIRLRSSSRSPERQSPPSRPVSWISEKHVPGSTFIESDADRLSDSPVSAGSGRFHSPSDTSQRSALPPWRSENIITSRDPSPPSHPFPSDLSQLLQPPRGPIEATSTKHQGIPTLDTPEKTPLQASVLRAFEERFKEGQKSLEKTYQEAEAERDERFREAEECRDGAENERHGRFKQNENNLTERFQAAMARHSGSFQQKQLARQGDGEWRGDLFKAAEGQRSRSFELYISRDREQYRATDALQTEFTKVVQSGIDEIWRIQQGSFARSKCRRIAVFKQSQARRLGRLETLLPSSPAGFPGRHPYIVPPIPLSPRQSTVVMSNESYVTPSPPSRAPHVIAPHVTVPPIIIGQPSQPLVVSMPMPHQRWDGSETSIRHADMPSTGLGPQALLVTKNLRGPLPTPGIKKEVKQGQPNFSKVQRAWQRRFEESQEERKLAFESAGLRRQLAFNRAEKERQKKFEEGQTTRKEISKNSERMRTDDFANSQASRQKVFLDAEAEREGKFRKEESTRDEEFRVAHFKREEQFDRLQQTLQKLCIESETGRRSDFDKWQGERIASLEVRDQEIRDDYGDEERELNGSFEEALAHIIGLL